MIGGDTDGPSIREEPLICSCDICCQNMKSRGEPMPHINHHLNNPAHPKSRNRIGKTVFLYLPSSFCFLPFPAIMPMKPMEPMEQTFTMILKRPTEHIPYMRPGKHLLHRRSIPSGCSRETGKSPNRSLCRWTATVMMISAKTGYRM